VKFQSHVTVAANPDLTFGTRLQPVGLDLHGEAVLEIVTGVICVEIAEIPVAFTIPFMPPHRRRVVAASLGPLGVRIDPAQATARAFGLRLGGAVGTEGVNGEVTALGKCRMEIDLAGEIPGRLIKAAVEGVFDDEPRPR
jgi:hypothetical protein